MASLRNLFFTRIRAQTYRQLSGSLLNCAAYLDSGLRAASYTTIQGCGSDKVKKSTWKNKGFENVETRNYATKSSKKEFKDDEIKFRLISLVSLDGQNLGTQETKRILNELDKTKYALKLVDVSQTPPVARIFDKQELREKIQAKKAAIKANKALNNKTGEIKKKEMEMTSSIAPHDLQFKSKKIADFLHSGYRVEVRVTTKDRSSNFKATSANVMQQILDQNKGFYSIIREPIFVGTTYTTFLEGKPKGTK